MWGRRREEREGGREGQKGGGRKLCMYRLTGNFRIVQNFAVFVNRSASARIKTAKIAASAISLALCLPVRAGAAKIKTAKISSGALRGDSAKFCARENFPLYGITCT